MRTTILLACLALTSTGASSCSGGSEPSRVEVPLLAGGEVFAAFTTDLGYEVRLDPLAVPMADLALTGPGEAHARSGALAPGRALTTLWSLMVPAAHAHPGHETGGAVLGERPGPFDARFGAGADESLGTATLLEGALRGGNLTVREASVLLSGEATKGGVPHPFELEVPIAAATRVEGIIFDLTVTAETRGQLVLTLLPVSARGRTLLDAVELAELDDDTQLTAARNAVRRALVDHAHYALNLEEME